MATITQFQPGRFCWTDLASTDATAAGRFYSQLFDWEITENPVGDSGVSYFIARKAGRDVAAYYQMDEAQKSEVPPHWMAYVLVEDVEKAVEKARALGGQIVVSPLTVMEAGRLAVIQDPQGAVLAMWQSLSHSGAQAWSEPGAPCWVELAAHDPEKAAAFYTALYGWKTHTARLGDVEYTSFLVDELPVGGMLQINESWGDVPSHWLVYFAVEDCDATVKTAQSLGGQVLVSPSDIPGVGRFAILQDPQGAVFAIIKLEPAAQN